MGFSTIEGEESNVVGGGGFDMLWERFGLF